MKGYKHLNLVQRSEISVLKASGKKQKDIAAYVGCSVATVSRELSRNKTKTGVYNPKTAQELANERKERLGRKRVFNQQKKSFVIHAIKEDNWSAEQIVGYCRENNIPMVGKTTIYEFIHQDKKKGGDLYTYTRHKLKHRNRELYNYKEKIADKKSIDERPAIVSQKTEFGHWEIDLIVGAGNKGAILTLVEMTTKMLFMRKLKEGKKAKSLADELIDMTLPYKNYIKTITADNGNEFSDFKRIEKKLNLQFFFAHPYSSWERGLSEHTNGLVRQYIPKNTDFKDITDKEIREYQYKINNRPRKVLDFQKPKDLFYQKVI